MYGKKNKFRGDHAHKKCNQILIPINGTTKVKIITKTASLKVRANPSSKAQVVAELPTKEIVSMFQESGQWYQIEYRPGKKGWISKKYAKLVN